MVIEFLWILLSLVFLFIGAEGLVRGSASLGLRAGLTPLVVGLTIVAFGTSSPELVVSIKSALSGQGDIAIGNVVGSNIFNIAVILALTAVVCPVRVQLQIVKIDAPVMIAVALLVPLLLLNGVVGRVEGAMLFTGLLAYIAFNIYLSRREADKPAALEAKEALPPRGGHWALDLLYVVGGLAILILGSRLLVDNSIIIARAWNISEAVIGLTIIAAGTSLPELATSLVAAIRKQPDIAVGNVVGSNIFNVLAILGAASLTSPLEMGGIGALDLAFMIGFSILLLPMLWTGLMLRRIEGGILFLGYFVYLWLLWPK